MGYPRRRPKRLAEKLKQIRESLGLSQSELVAELGLDFHYSYISKFELGRNEPDMIVILAYARLVGVPMEQFADDGLELDL